MPVTINGTTGIVNPDGSAGTPSLAGSDTNTGVFFPAADTVAIATGGTEAVRVDSSRNVGIGTSSPLGKLDVALTAGSASGLYFSLGGSSETTRITTNSSTGEMRIGQSNASAGNYFQTFYTVGAERARIDTSGGFLFKGGSADLYLNQTATSRYWQHNKASSEGSGFTYHVFQNNGSGIGSITWNGSGTSFNTTSDYRLKENVQPMVGALSKVAALKPCTYTWKADGSAGEGFIAHELAAVAPQCVAGEKDAVDSEGNPVYQGIDTSFLVATLTAAIQEQQAMIVALKAEVDALKGAQA